MWTEHNHSLQTLTQANTSIIARLFKMLCRRSTSRQGNLQFSTMIKDVTQSRLGNTLRAHQKQPAAHKRRPDKGNAGCWPGVGSLPLLVHNPTRVCPRAREGGITRAEPLTSFYARDRFKTRSKTSLSPLMSWAGRPAEHCLHIHFESVIELWHGW